MAKVTAGDGASHVPAIGIAMDTGITDQPYWRPVFAEFEKSREWTKEQKPDVMFLDLMTTDSVAGSQISHVEYLRESASEGIELVMWHVTRGTLDHDVTEVHRHYHVPASNSAVGHIILENKT